METGTARRVDGARIPSFFRVVLRTIHKSPVGPGSTGSYSTSRARATEGDADENAFRVDLFFSLTPRERRCEGRSPLTEIGRASCRERVDIMELHCVLTS